MNDPTDSYSALHEEEMAQQKQFDDKELADKIVALGVGQHRKFGGVPIRYRFIGSDENMYASDFVRDWRVVGALMQKCLDHKKDFEISLERDITNNEYFASVRSYMVSEGQAESGESLPRAINEACVEALQNS